VRRIAIEPARDLRLLEREPERLGLRQPGELLAGGLGGGREGQSESDGRERGDRDRS
jgi:hypothetical protein